MMVDDELLNSNCLSKWIWEWMNKKGVRDLGWNESIDKEWIKEIIKKDYNYEHVENHLINFLFFWACVVQLFMGLYEHKI